MSGSVVATLNSKDNSDFEILLSVLQSIAPILSFFIIVVSRDENNNVVSKTTATTKKIPNPTSATEAYLLAYIYTFRWIISITIITIPITTIPNESINKQTNQPTNQSIRHTGLASEQASERNQMIVDLSAKKTFHREPKAATSISTCANHFLSILINS
jgi:hypothetical protein